MSDKLREAIAADDTARGTMRGEFEAWWAEEGYKFIMANVFTKDAAWGGAQWQASRAAAPQSVEPLFLLHCGALFGGERDDWEVEAYSGKAVDAFADAHAGQTIVLYAAPPTAPTDAEWQAENERLRVALRFYARGEHYNLDESEEFDTVSGEPENWLCSGVEDSSTMIENGRVALFALRGIEANWIDGDEDCTPQPVEGEKALRAHIATRPAPPLELAGWQQRYIDPEEGPSLWQACLERDAQILTGRNDYELRKVYAFPAPPTKTKENGA